MSNAKNFFYIGSVVATYSEGNWYRAQVIDVDEKKYESANVFFLDYGGCKKIDQCDMRPMHDSLISLSFQAIECSLANIAPSEFIKNSLCVYVFTYFFIIVLNFV